MWKSRHHGVIEGRDQRERGAKPLYRWGPCPLVSEQDVRAEAERPQPTA
jgi:hypothetical protein